jgi:hypothetical protein
MLIVKVSVTALQYLESSKGLWVNYLASRRSFLFDSCDLLFNMGEELALLKHL